MYKFANYVRRLYHFIKTVHKTNYVCHIENI